MKFRFSRFTVSFVQRHFWRRRLPLPGFTGTVGGAQGKVEKFSFAESKMYPGRVGLLVYVPAQYDAANPAC